jgi:hypothetical protein
MKVDREYILRLGFDEAVALKILLGKRSQTTDVENGLTLIQSEKMTELYDQLPHDEEN